MSVYSILNEMFHETEQPILQKDLIAKRESLFSKLNIGSTRIFHKNCGHFYYVLKGSLREDILKKSPNYDDNNCFVCSKLLNTPPELKTKADLLVYSYSRSFKTKPEYMLQYSTFIESKFYRWLYTEFKYKI